MLTERKGENDGRYQTLTVKKSREEYDDLLRLANKQGITLAAYLGQAFDLSRLVLNAKAEGQEVLLKDGNSYQRLRLAS